MKTVPSDTWLRIVIPFAIILSSILAQGYLLLPITQHAIWGIIRIIVFIILNFELGRWLTISIRKRLASIVQSQKRLILSYLGTLSLSFIIISLSTIIVRTSTVKSISWNDEMLINFLQCIWIALLIVVPEEIYYSYTLSFHSEKEKSELQKLNLQFQLSQLKEILNPHFLFNTLNDLSALVIQNPKKAEEYIIELSGLYRYVLNNNEKSFITLEEEIAFAEKYIKLMQMRLGNSLQLKKQIDVGCLELQLPPLTIQVLLENAIQHNIIQPHNPLLIEIICSKKTLKIINNKQLKLEKYQTHGKGLYSIISRYRLLGFSEINIESTDNQFCVSIPLIQAADESFNN